jgi:hypothetical protein
LECPLLAAARGSKRPLQPGRRKPAPQARRAGGQSSAQDSDVAAESVKEFPARRRRPAAMLRDVMSRLADGFRIAVHIIRRL